MLTLAICLGMMIPAFGLSSESQKANIELDLDDKESDILGTVPVDLIQSYCQFNLGSETLQSEAREKLNSQFPELAGSADIDFARLYASTKQSISEATRNATRNIDRSVQVPSVNSVRNINSTAIVSNESELIAALLDTSVTVIIVTTNIQLTDARAMNRSLVIMAMNGSKTIISPPGKPHFLIRNQSAPISITFIDTILDGNNLGGGIVIENSDVTLNGVKIQNCAENGACSGNAIDASNIALDPVSNELQITGDLTLNLGELTGNECGGVSCTGPISIYGATISGNSGSGVSAINLCEEGATAYFEGVSITGNESEIRGGGLFLWGYTVIITGKVSNGQVIIESDISGNAAQYGGGGIYAYLCSTDISYTNLEENKIEFVEPSVSTIDPIDIGGAGIMNVGNLSIESSTVQDNRGDCDFGFGVGIYVLDPAVWDNNFDEDDYPWLSEGLTVRHSTISGNKCAWATGNDPYSRYMNGGGIAVFGYKPTLTDTTITDNMALIGGGAIFYYAYDEDELEQSDDPAAHFYGVKVEENIGKLAGGGLAMIGPGGVSNDYTGIPATVKSAMQIEAYSEVSPEIVSEVKNNTSRFGAGIAVFNVELTVTEGTIIQNNIASKTSYTATLEPEWPQLDSAGGGILLSSAKLTLSDALITLNTLLTTSGYNTAGAGIYAKGASTVLMNHASAKVNNNSTTGNGGGIHVESDTTLTISNGEIKSNEAHFGGGISARRYSGSDTATVTISGGLIKDNQSSKGGGVYAVLTPITMTGGTIQENTSLTSGGGVFVSSTFVMTAGSIIGNTATRFGGGIHAVKSIEIGTINGSNNAVLIQGNTAGREGGGIAADGLAPASCTVYSGMITSNEAGINGGGIYSIATFNMVGGVVFFNTAPNGGGVYLTEGPSGASMSGGSIHHNIAIDGGGIYTKRNMSLTGGSITENTASDPTISSGHGGGLYIADTAIVENIGQHCNISNNYADVSYPVYLYNIWIESTAQYLI